MKKETLEEAAKFWVCNKPESNYHAFLAGANYKPEKMFSEEDMKKAYERGMFAIIETGHGDTFEEWFEQFKKK
jgi:hypothetical protein